MNYYHFKIVSVQNPARVRNFSPFIALLIIILLNFVTYGEAQSATTRSLTTKLHPNPIPNDKGNPFYPPIQGASLIPKTKGLLAKRDLNLNTHALFTGTNDPIMCRHLSLEVLNHVSPAGEIDLTPYASTSGISEKIAFDMEAQLNRLLTEAPDVHMIENKKLGEFSETHLTEMSAKEIPIQKILMSSGEHAMGLWLTISHENDGPMYGVHVYDPNYTVIYKSVTTASLSDIGKLSLTSFIDSHNYETYYHPRGSDNSVSMLFFLSEQCQDTPKQERRLTRHTGTLTSEVFYHLMDTNFHEDITRHFSDFSKKNLTKRAKQNIINILLDTENNRPPSLYIALQKNNKAAINAYFAGITTLGFSKKTILHLVTAKTKDGIPGLHMALQRDSDAAVTAYFEGIQSLHFSKKELLSLVKAKLSDGTPGLYIALQMNSHNTVHAYFEGIKSLGFSNDEVLDLARAPRKDGLPGLYAAFQTNSKDSITAYLREIASLDLSKEELLALVAAKDFNGVPGLALALHQNSTDAITAYLRGLQDLGLSKKDLLSLVSAKTITGETGISFALTKNSKAAIRAYFKGLTHLGISKADFTSGMSAKQPNGRPSLNMAAYPKEAVAAYNKGLQSLS